MFFIYQPLKLIMRIFRQLKTNVITNIFKLLNYDVRVFFNVEINHLKNHNNPSFVYLVKLKPNTTSF